MDRGALLCAKIDAGDGASENGDDAIKVGEKGMGNGDATTNSGAALLFPLLEFCESQFTMFRWQGTDFDQAIDEFDDGRQLFFGFQVRKNPVRGE